MHPLELYREFYSHYGSQNWWPVTEKRKIKPEYKKRKQLTEAQKLEVCFGAILTQNTSWKNVEKALIELNKNNLINAKKIISIKKRKLSELIKPAGYFNQKAGYLKEFCANLKKYGYSVNSFFVSSLDLRKELLSIKGIGKETADSILLYAAKKPFFVVDAFTKRIISRISGEKEKKYEELQEFFHSSLERNSGLFSEFHALFVEHAKTFCQKKPLCSKCFLRNKCNFWRKQFFKAKETKKAKK
jgi:endonuclease-3 related protein